MALRKFTRNLGMFPDFFELIIENKKTESSGKTVLIIQSQMYEKMAVGQMTPKNGFEKKVGSLVFKIYVFFTVFTFLY